MGLVRLIPLVYAGLCLLAFGALAASTPLFAGEDADPLGGIFVFLLALPWILTADLFGEVSLWVTILLSIGSMALNFVILRAVAKRLSGIGKKETR